MIALPHLILCLICYATSLNLLILSDRLKYRNVNRQRELWILAITTFLMGMVQVPGLPTWGAVAISWGACLSAMISFAILVQVGLKFLRWLDEHRRMATLLDDFQAKMSTVSAQSETALQLEMQLHRSNESLQQANDELTRFVYVASHDLLAPLRTIINFLQRLDRRLANELASDPKASEYLQRALNASERLQFLIRDLGHFTKLGRESEPPMLVDLNKVVNAVLEDLSLPIRNTGAVIEQDSLPCVTGNESQLVQLFENLIANAIKYQPPSQTPRIRIECVEITLSWMISITDNGIGIEPQHQAQIFDVFQRLHTEEEYPGTGMGLAIVKRIIDRHQGRIWIESTPGVGSSFHFTLPA